MYCYPLAFEALRVIKSNGTILVLVVKVLTKRKVVLFIVEINRFPLNLTNDFVAAKKTLFLLNRNLGCHQTLKRNELWNVLHPRIWFQPQSATSLIIVSLFVICNIIQFTPRLLPWRRKNVCIMCEARDVAAHLCQTERGVIV